MGASGRAGIVSGHGVTTGGETSSARGRQSRGAALASPPPLRGGATGAARQPPGSLPRAGRRMVPAVTSARAGSVRTANVLDHQDDYADRGNRAKLKSRRSPLGRG